MNLGQIVDIQRSFVQRNPKSSALCLLFGFLTVARFVYQASSVFLQIFLFPGKNLKHFGAKSGAWAVITGASDGIGKEFAYELAKAGFNIFLIARNELLLEMIASDIRTRYPGALTATHSMDFCRKNETSYNALCSALEGKEIAILVNNVGKSHKMPVYFAETPLDEMSDIVAINVSATLRVTHIILPKMIERKNGLILNIGSFAGAVPSPMLATYSGTKAFLATFSSALSEEVRRHGIVVEHVNTYFVVSKLSKIRKPSLFVPLPNAYVRSVLAKLGLPCGASYSGRPGTSTPYWSHGLIDYAMTLIGLPSIFISYTHGLHQTIRMRAMKKLGKVE